MSHDSLQKTLLLVLIFLLGLFLVFRFTRINEGFDDPPPPPPTQSQAQDGLLPIPPSPDVMASPAPQAQTAEGNAVYLASSPGSIPGAVELTQGTTAFTTNTPSRYVQQFASSTIVTNSQANSAYATLMNYLSQNPSQSFMFLKDIRDKFFTTDAVFNQNIDFKKLAASDTMIFT